MAKKVNEEAVEAPNVEMNENANEAPTPAPVESPMKEAKATTIKKVRIRAFEPINCIIAGTPYRINKDTESAVPTDVAAILVNSGKAYRI